MVKQATSEQVAPNAPPATYAAPAPAPATYGAPATGTYGAPATARAPGRFDNALKGIRIAQLVLSLIILGVSAAIVYAVRHTCVEYTDGFYDYCEIPAVAGYVSFNLFNSVWTFLITIYLIVAAFRVDAHQPIAAIVLDALSVIFWFSGFIAAAVYVGVFSEYYGVTNGYLAGVTALAAVEWALFVCTLVFEAMHFKAANTHHTTSTPMQQYPNTGVAQHA